MDDITEKATITSFAYQNIFTNFGSFFIIYNQTCLKKNAKVLVKSNSAGIMLAVMVVSPCEIAGVSESLESLLHSRKRRCRITDSEGGITRSSTPWTMATAAFRESIVDTADRRFSMPLTPFDGE